MRILISACLLGYNCKYNGKNNLNKKIVELLKDHEVIPVCPEMLGGLCCPRIPCEKVGDRILDKEGNDCTKQFIKGAEKIIQAPIWYMTVSEENFLISASEPFTEIFPY